MSKLGDVLKELFPLRAMGAQTFDALKGPQITKFGQDAASQIKNVTAATIGQIQTKIQPLSDKIKAGYNSPQVQNRLEHLKNAFSPQVGGNLGRGILGGIGNVGRSAFGAAAASVAGIGAGFKYLGGKLGGGGNQNEEKVDKLQNNLGGLEKVSSSLLVSFLKFAGLGYLFHKMGDLFRKFTGDLSESNRELGLWNGAIAVSTQRLDLTKMKLDIQTGRATSGTAGELNKQIGELLQEFQPIREDISKISNVIGIQLAQGAKTLIQIAKTVAEYTPWLKGAKDALDKIEDDLKKNQNDIPVGNQILSDLTNMKGKGHGAGQQLPGPQPPPDLFLRRHKQGKAK